MDWIAIGLDGFFLLYANISIIAFTTQRTTRELREPQRMTKTLWNSELLCGSLCSKSYSGKLFILCNNPCKSISSVSSVSKKTQSVQPPKTDR